MQSNGARKFEQARATTVNGSNKLSAITDQGIGQLREIRRVADANDSMRVRIMRQLVNEHANRCVRRQRHTLFPAPRVPIHFSENRGCLTCASQRADQERVISRDEAAQTLRRKQEELLSAHR